MALAAAVKAGKRKRVTREAQYKKLKAAESGCRNFSSSNGGKSTSNGSTPSIKGKGKAKEVEENLHPFRYKSFNDRLANVHINISNSLGRSGTGALSGLEGHGVLPVAGSSSRMQMDVADDDEVSDEDEDETSALHAKTSFGVALNSWKELNLSLPFTLISQQTQPLSHSLPMLLHYQEKISTLLAEGLLASHRDSYLGYEPFLDLIPRLANDLGSAFLPSFSHLLAATLRITAISKLNTDGDEYNAAMLVERAFESAAATLRCVAPFVLREQKGVVGETQDWLQTTWHIMRPYLGWRGEEASGKVIYEDNEMVEEKDDTAVETEKSLERSQAVSKIAKITAHTRRFASEALAHLARRAKGDQLTRMARVMMEDLQMEIKVSTGNARVFCSGIAGVWLEVAKSVDHRLHSSATDQLSALLMPVDVAATHEASLVRRLVGCDIITALVHHCQSANLIPIFEWLSTTADSRLNIDSVNTREGQDDLQEVTDWLIAFVGTRKGKRVDESIKSQLFSYLVRYVEVLNELTASGDTDLTATILKLIALSLPLGRIQDLIGPGKRIIDALATVDEDGNISHAFITLATSLGQPDFDFASYNQMILPAVMASSTRSLRAINADGEIKTATLCFLASLQMQGRFGKSISATPTSTNWVKAVSAEVEKTLSNWILQLKQEEFAGQEGIVACLSLTAVDKGRTDKMAEILCDALSYFAKIEGMSEEECDTTALNKAAMLGAILEALSSLLHSAGVKSIQDRLSSISNLELLPITFAKHRYVIISYSNLAVQMKALSCSLPCAPLDNTIDSMIIALTFSDEPLRLAAARLLAISEEQHSAAEAHCILGGLVEIEETALTIENVRERNVRTRALARSVVSLKQQSSEKSGHVDLCAKIVIAYLVSVFKLNFRPLWEESRKALVDLSVVYGQLVWDTAFVELTSAQLIATLPSSWPQKKQEAIEDAADDSIDKQFIDPQLTQRKQIVTTACATAQSNTILQSIINSQRPAGRLDLINYQGLILSLFGSISSVAEKNNAVLMRHFFDTIVARQDGDGDLEGDEEDEESVEVKTDSIKPTMPQRRSQLCSYLETFAQFSNPKALYRSQDLHDYLYRLCSQGDNKIQTLALDVILQWKDPAHTTYQATLKKLLDQSQFREQLTSLDLSPSGEFIQQAHRARLLPLLIRLFFGIMVSKRGRASQGSGQTGRKNTIFTALSELPCEELTPLIDVMLEPFEDVRQSSADGGFTFSANPPSASSGRQSGFLAMLGDVIKHLGLKIVPLWDRLLVVLLNLTYHASRRAGMGQGKATSTDRSIRQGGLRRIDDFFKQPTDTFNWSPYIRSIFEHLVSPRLPMLRVESIQSPSALLDLIHTWSHSSQTVMYLVDYDSTLLEHTFACLQMPSVKSSVINIVLDVAEGIISYSSDHSFRSEVEGKILKPHTTVILSGLNALVQRCNSLGVAEAKAIKRDDLMRRLLQILSTLAAYVVTVDDASSLLDALSPLLRNSNTAISEKSRVDLLQVYQHLLGLIPAMQNASSSEFKSQHQLFSSLFSRLRSRGARLALTESFAKLAKADENLSLLTTWIRDLNSYDVKRMEEYDFERRLGVFDIINEGLNEKSISVLEWLPLLHNFLFNLQDADELAIRSNAGTALRKFIDLVSTTQEDSSSLQSLFKDVVYPGLRRTLRSKSDMVQRETVNILGYAVSHLGTSIGYLNEMTPLLVDGDEEANFFNNIFHIQLHRRIRALNRLGQEAEKDHFSSRTIVEILLPLVDQFLNTDTHHGEANLISAAVETLGRLSKRLKWGPYNVLLWKFLSIGKKTRDGEKEKEKSDKVCVRAAMSILDNFHFEMDESIARIEPVDEAMVDGEEVDGEDLEMASNRVQAEAEESRKIMDAVMNRLIPKLMDFLDQKDELEDTVRLPIAIGIARVMLRLPQPERHRQITRMLTILANVFKSKTQDTRDLARVTLGRVASSLGSEYLPTIVKELRRALVRGPQRAVLAYTVHNILIQCMSNQERPLEILQAGTADVVDVVMEDLFGHTSEDRESIENRTTYKEVKSVKSLDTLEQISNIVASDQISTLLAPLRDLMHQTEAVKAVKSMDDYLKRVAAGLHVNVHLSSGDFLLLCHSLFTNNANFLQSSTNDSRKKQSRVSAVLRKRSELEEGAGRDHYARNAYKFVAFGLDLLVNALRKGRFDYSDSDVLARLDPMVAAVGNSLFSQQASILVSGFKALALLVKCPVSSVQSTLPLIVKQTLKIVEKEGTNAQSDILMSALKLLTVIIRDVESSSLQDRQVIQLCQLIDMNLEEDFEMQGVLFGLLRSIVGRKFVVVEVYDVMDKVANMMITNQSASIRDTSRSTYLTFLLEYPQGKTRFNNQMRFLAKNISYVFESGRLSLFELLRVLLIKVNEETLREHLNLLFVSLVMSLGNDESSKCKEKVANLIKQILDLCRDQEREKLVSLVNIWSQSDKEEKKELLKIALMIYGLFFETQSLQDEEGWKSSALLSARRVISSSAMELEEREVDDTDIEEMGQDWQLPYQALQVVSKLYSNKHNALDQIQVLWIGIQGLLLFPHTWVRSAACRIIGQRLSRTEVQRPKTSGDCFLSLANVLLITRKSSLMLKSDHLDEALALQLVKNLVFVGKCFALVPIESRESSEGEEESDEEEGGETQEDHDWSMENPLRWMFAKLSHQLRQCRLTSASMESINMAQPSSLLKWIAAMVQHLSIESVEAFLTHIVSPLYRLLEAEAHLARNNDSITTLQALANEVQELIQKKVGTTVYSYTYSQIKQKMADRRRKRKSDALMLAIENPEKAMQRKATINKRKHESRKRKTTAFAKNKEHIRPTKRQR